MVQFSSVNCFVDTAMCKVLYFALLHGVLFTLVENRVKVM